MIDFLKESTFAVNDVVNKSWEILYKNYRNIAGLCLAMFTVSWLSKYLSSFVEKGVSVMNIAIVIAFIILYSGLQLTLFKYVLYAMTMADKDQETFTHKFVHFLKDNVLTLVGLLLGPFLFILLMAVVSNLLNIDPFLVQTIGVIIGLGIVIIIFWNQIKPFLLMIGESWPTKRQVGNFFLATISVFLIIAVTFGAIGVILFPLSFLGFPGESLAGIAVSIGVLLALIVLIRIFFFPFFIIDLNTGALKSIRFSLAITRGNFTRLLLLILLTLLFLFIGESLQAYEYYFLSLAVSLAYFFIITPLYSVAATVAYKQMMDEYKGDSDPDIIHNLI